MKALVAALNRIATALEQLVPALQQATREARRVEQFECECGCGDDQQAFSWDAVRASLAEEYGKPYPQ